MMHSDEQCRGWLKRAEQAEAEVAAMKAERIDTGIGLSEQLLKATERAMQAEAEVALRDRMLELAHRQVLRATPEQFDRWLADLRARAKEAI